MKYLIDTDWIVDFLNGRRPTVAQLGQLAEEGARISLVTYGEIYEGILFGRNQEVHEAGFLSLLRIIDVLPLNHSIMERFAQIRGQLRSTGQLIGDLDILIAATAIHHDLALVSNNARHFGRIPTLRLYRPT